MKPYCIVLDEIHTKKKCTGFLCVICAFFNWSVAFPNKCSDNNLLIFMDSTGVAEEGLCSETRKATAVLVLNMECYKQI